ncbi:MAG: DUF3048 domain-containing protein [Lachnospiraceae bacterium]|nr:DUF3048 domain-containing protein [Lachnospiraceae bacterium]
MKRKIFTAMLVALCVTAAGCKAQTGSPIIQELEVESSGVKAPGASGQERVGTGSSPQAEEPEVEPDAIKERKVVDGMKQSYLTGEWKKQSIVDRRPLAIMVPNNPPAMPQYGLSRASIVYEAPVEGRITRLMCVVEDYDDLKYIGPIRSSRDYYIYEAMALDAIYCNWGLAVPYVQDLINSDRVDNISQAVVGIESPYEPAFSRRSDRRSGGYATEFTAYMWIAEAKPGESADAPESSVKGYIKGVESKGYGKTYAESGRFAKQGRDPAAYLFADDGRKKYEEYPDAQKICPGGTQSNKGGYGQNNATFTYDPDDGFYYRSQYGAPQIDELTGKQVAVTNIIFKVCHGEVRDAHDYLKFTVQGTGDAYVFTNGKMIKATWKHEGDYDANHFYDESGNEIILNQGATWLCNIWDNYKEYATVDGSPIFQ